MKHQCLLRFLWASAMALSLSVASAWVGMEVKPLHVDGRYLKDADGHIVNLHGFAQTYSPWFNERGTRWSNYDVNACLSYNKQKIDQILAAGWMMSFVRIHCDPYWSNTPGIPTTGENDISAFSMTRFKKYLREVFIPMALYAQQKGLYVVMRPPGVCPENIAEGDAYQQYLLQVWDVIAQQPELKDNPAIMYELANEPIHITATAGKSESQSLHDFFQAVTDVVRQHCQNIILVPGTGWQSQYGAYAEHPITGGNIGYAVHCYPGWYNSGVEGNVSVNYQDFRRGWRAQIGCVARFAPIVVTEMDWAPADYNASWGKAVTGEAGGTGFGANFRKITDETGNVSWLLFTECHLLAQFVDQAPANGQYTFLTDPEACPWPCYHWYQEYATKEWQETDYGGTSGRFPLTADDFNPSIWETGTFNEATRTLHTGQYGFGGWEYAPAEDFSAYRYIVVELDAPQSCGASFRIFDEQSYWSKPFAVDFGTQTRLVIDLHTMKKQDTGAACDPSHIYRVGFWSYGSGDIRIGSVYLSNDGVTPVETLIAAPGIQSPVADVYTLSGRLVRRSVAVSSALQGLPRGLYIIGGRKVMVK